MSKLLTSTVCAIPRTLGLICGDWHERQYFRRRHQERVGSLGSQWKHTNEVPLLRLSFATIPLVGQTDTPNTLKAKKATLQSQLMAALWSLSSHQAKAINLQESNHREQNT